MCTTAPPKTAPPQTLARPRPIRPPGPPEANAASWYAELGSGGRKAFKAAFAGYSLDAFDLIILTLSLAAVGTTFDVSKGATGLLATVTLTASAGGLLRDVHLDPDLPRGGEGSFDRRHERLPRGGHRGRLHGLPRQRLGVGFFASGCFSGFGAFFPGIIGFLAATVGLGGAVAFGVFGYVLAIGALRFLPETNGKELVPVLVALGLRASSSTMTLTFMVFVALAVPKGARTSPGARRAHRSRTCGRARG